MLIYDEINKEYYNVIPVKKVEEKIEEYKHKDFIATQVVMKRDKEALKIVEVLQQLIKENTEEE